MASIRTRQGAKGQTHQITWWDPILKKQGSETHADLREAKKRLKIIEGMLAQDKGPVTPGKITYQEWYDRWMDEDVSVRLTPKVKSQYEAMHRKFVLPFWSKTALQDIGPDQVIAWFKWMQTQTKSAWTMLEAFMSMSSCLSYFAFMEKKRGIVYINPLHGMRRLLPKTPRPKNHTILDPQQIQALSEVVQPRYKALILVLGTHGLRPSEAFALTLGDVDLLEGTIKVTKAVVNVAGHMTLKDETKNGEDRTIYLLGFTKEALIDHIAEFCDPSDDASLLFPSAQKNEYIHTDFFTSWVTKRGGVKIGIPNLTTYDLRHSANKNMLRYGRDPRLASDMLGNSPEVNAKHYDHSTREDIDRGNALLEEAFKKGPPGAQEAS